MSFNCISFIIQDDIALIGLASSSSTQPAILTLEMLLELEAAFQIVQTSESNLRGLILFSHAESAFLVGTNIQGLNQTQSEFEVYSIVQRVQKTFCQLANLRIPTIACIHGLCYGAGVELALCCKTILVSDSSETKISFPEVKLGLMPGFGGTLRLPERVGLASALSMILTAKTLTGKELEKSGFATASYAKERLIALAKERHLIKSAKRGSFFDVFTENRFVRKIIFEKARDAVMKQSKGFFEAPLRILDTMENLYKKSRESYLELEARAAGELLLSDQSFQLNRLSLLVEKNKARDERFQHIDLSKAAIVGATDVGGNLLWLMLSKKIAVVLIDSSLTELSNAIARASLLFQESVLRKKMTMSAVQVAMRSASPMSSFTGIKRSQLVIEAVDDNFLQKSAALKSIEVNLPADALICSATASVSITEMAKTLTHPGRFAGLCFSAPISKKSLVEVITHNQVTEETISFLKDWCISLGKIPVVVKDGPCFLVGRVLCAYFNETMLMIEEGVALKQIEEVSLRFGMPTGPGRFMDELGIDFVRSLETSMQNAKGDSFTPSKISKMLFEMGALGKKTSKGFYLYEDNKEKSLNGDLLQPYCKDLKVVLSQEILDRLLYRIINETLHILDEGLIFDPDQVDLAMMLGIGFPSFEGGPLSYLRKVGQEKILTRMKTLEEQYGAVRFAPSKLLIDRKF